MEDRGPMTDGYVPGVCNIGPAEIARRRRVGHVALAVTLALLAALITLGADPLWRLLVIPPAAGAAAGYLQARLRFCAYYGLRGLASLGEAGAARPVEAREAIARDRRRALGIGLASLAIGSAVGLASLLL